jgi:hypothetical protein
LPPAPQQQPTGTAQAINVMEEILIAAIDSIQDIGVTATTGNFQSVYCVHLFHIGRIFWDIMDVTSVFEDFEFIV